MLTKLFPLQSTSVAVVETGVQPLPSATAAVSATNINMSMLTTVAEKVPIVKTQLPLTLNE